MAAINNMSPQSAQIAVEGTPVLPAVTTERGAGRSRPRRAHVVADGLTVSGADLARHHRFGRPARLGVPRRGIARRVAALDRCRAHQPSTWPTTPPTTDIPPTNATFGFERRQRDRRAQRARPGHGRRATAARTCSPRSRRAQTSGSSARRELRWSRPTRVHHRRGAGARRPGDDARHVDHELRRRGLQRLRREHRDPDDHDRRPCRPTWREIRLHHRHRPGDQPALCRGRRAHPRPDPRGRRHRRRHVLVVDDAVQRRHARRLPDRSRAATTASTSAATRSASTRRCRSQVARGARWRSPTTPATRC